MLKLKDLKLITVEELEKNSKTADILKFKESKLKKVNTMAIDESINEAVGKLNFEELNSKTVEKYKLLSRNIPYLLACYSAGQLMMWKDFYNASFATISGCVIIKVVTNKKTGFFYPFAYEENGDINAALKALENYASKNYIPYSLVAVPRSELPNIAARYTNASFSVNRNSSDYIYLTTDIQNFVGKKYSGQRNHINKFKKLYPDAVFRELNDNDSEKLEKFWEKYETGFNKTSYVAKIELEDSKKVFSSLRLNTDYMACIELNDQIISICYGEKCGDMLIIHIEKSLDGFDGLYPFMVNNFAKTFGNGCDYINREDDAGSKGLRTSKNQYQPIKIEEKISVNINTELTNLNALPKINTDNLIIDAITEEDIPLYNKLCLDDKHNKYWGYDYKEHFKGIPPYDYFYKGAEIDFNNKVSLTLAIRYNGNFIGEAVICEFDFRGSANLGLRLLPEFTGKGFGKEAFAAVADWAIYGLGLSSVTAYCFKQNIPSLHMLSSCMASVREDEKYCYFEKSI